MGFPIRESELKFSSIVIYQIKLESFPVNFWPAVIGEWSMMIGQSRPLRKRKFLKTIGTEDSWYRILTLYWICIEIGFDFARWICSDSIKTLLLCLTLPFIRFFKVTSPPEKVRIGSGRQVLSLIPCGSRCTCTTRPVTVRLPFCWDEGQSCRACQAFSRWRIFAS